MARGHQRRGSCRQPGTSLANAQLPSSLTDTLADETVTYLPWRLACSVTTVLAPDSATWPVARTEDVADAECALVDLVALTLAALPLAGVTLTDVIRVRRTGLRPLVVLVVV